MYKWCVWIGIFIKEQKSCIENTVVRLRENLLFLSPRDRPEEVHLCARRAASRARVHVSIYVCGRSLRARSLLIRRPAGPFDDSRYFRLILDAHPSLRRYRFCFLSLFIAHCSSVVCMKCITLQQQPSLPNPRWSRGKQGAGKTTTPRPTAAG